MVLFKNKSTIHIFIIFFFVINLMKNKITFQINVLQAQPLFATLMENKP